MVSDKQKLFFCRVELILYKEKIVNIERKKMVLNNQKRVYV
jgi:hypothetical protein